MAIQIEFLSSVDGRDLVPVKSSSVWNLLKEIRSAMRRVGYFVSGNIEFTGEEFTGEYRAFRKGEEVTFHVVNV